MRKTLDDELVDVGEGYTLVVWVVIVVRVIDDGLFNLRDEVDLILILL
jgi:hypothetical protein